jgi:hypothetical protein
MPVVSLNAFASSYFFIEKFKFILESIFDSEKYFFYLIVFVKILILKNNINFSLI